MPATSEVVSHDLHTDPGSASSAILNAGVFPAAVGAGGFGLGKCYQIEHAWSMALPMELLPRSSLAKLHL